MSLLGGAYDDSDSEDEPTTTTVVTAKVVPPTSAAHAAASASASAVGRPASSSTAAAAPKSAAAKRKNNRRKVVDISRLIKRRNHVEEDPDVIRKQEEDLGVGSLRKQALAAKNASHIQQYRSAQDDESFLGALPTAGAAASSSSTVPASFLKQVAPVQDDDTANDDDDEDDDGTDKREMTTSLDLKDHVNEADIGDGDLFTLESRQELLEDDESQEPEEDDDGGGEDVGPAMPSDWDQEKMEAQYQQPDTFAGLGKDTLLSDREKRALAMGSNIKEINPSQLQDTDWRRKQLASELPNMPKHEKRIVTTGRYSVEDQGRVTGAVTGTQKRKHQIGYLAQSYADASYDLAMRDMEQAGKKHATHQKYGW